RLARSLLEPVEEVVVAFLERLRLRRAMLAAAAVDVHVSEASQQPGTQVSTGSVRLPAAEGARVCLLHQVLGLLAAADEPPRHPVDLISKLQRLLFEPHAVACLGRQSAGLGRRHFAHAGHPSRRFPKLKRAREQGYSCGRELPAAVVTAAARLGTTCPSD